MELAVELEFGLVSAFVFFGVEEFEGVVRRGEFGFEALVWKIGFEVFLVQSVEHNVDGYLSVFGFEF